MAAKKWAAFALAFGTAFTAAPLTPTTPASAATGTHDGSSSDKAAASCYEVKQVNPSGLFWYLLAVHPADERSGAVLLRSGN